MHRIYAALVALFAFVLALGAHCQPLPILSDLAKCEETAAAKDLPALLPVVGAIILSGGTNAAVDAALIGIAVQFGADSLDCAVAALKAAWEQITAPSTQPATQSALVARLVPTVDKATAARGIARAEAWLKTRGQTKRTVGP